MFCPYCGSQIADGSKFCTECGARLTPMASVEPAVPEDPPVPAEPAPAAEPAAPAEPASAAPGYSAPSWEKTYRDDDYKSAAPSTPSWQPESAPQPTPGQTTYSAPSQGYTPSSQGYAPSSTPAPDASAGNAGGWSTPGGPAPSYPRQSYSAPPAAAKTPITKKWWFWVILAVVIIAVLLAVAVSALVRSRGPVAELDEDVIEQIVETAPQEPGTEPDVSEPDTGSDFLQGLPDTGAAGSLSFDECYDALVKQLDDSGIPYEIERDEDGWLFIDLTIDGMTAIADSAAAGDSADMARWEEILQDFIDTSWSLGNDFRRNGQDAVICLSMADDTDPDYMLCMAVDGDLYYDFATNVDLLGD